MKRYLILGGPIGATIFWFGVVLLPLWVPGYSYVRQTVSEIGMVGSPMRTPFTILLCVTALCMLIFGIGICSASLRAGHSPLAGYLVACMAISAAGAGVFPYPKAPHSYFGLSELIAYQAPLAFALTWRRNRHAATAVRLSWVMSVLMWASIALNLSVFDRGGGMWAYERPLYGLVQRSLFAAFFLWCALAGTLLFAGVWRESHTEGAATIEGF